MNMHLVVVKPFAGFVKGDIVTNEAQIAEIMRGEHAVNVVRVVTSSQQEN